MRRFIGLALVLTLLFTIPLTAHATKEGSTSSYDISCLDGLKSIAGSCWKSVKKFFTQTLFGPRVNLSEYVGPPARLYICKHCHHPLPRCTGKAGLQRSKTAPLPTQPYH